jgi:hypothetical protein
VLIEWRVRQERGLEERGTYDESRSTHLLGIGLFGLGVRDGGDVSAEGFGEEEAEMTGRG